VEQVLGQFGGGQFSRLKEALAELSVAKLGPIGQETRRLKGDSGYVEGILADGSARARAIAGPILRETRKIVGFVVS